MIPGRAHSRILTAAFVLASSAVPALAQLCPGDADNSSSVTSNMANPNQVKIWARTRLTHTANHTTCSGIVGSRAELWVSSSSTSCDLTTYNGSATATTSSVNHEKTSERVCTVYGCSSGYQTRGRHYFNGATFKNTMGGTVTAACNPPPSCNPCSGPGLSPGGTCPDQARDACGCCPNASPLVIDRSGNGLRFSSAEDGALLNVNGEGLMLWLGWPTSADDAWLALDRNGNGRVDDGSELFGNTRRLADGRAAEHGYEVLAELDENGDGVVDANDPAFGQLLLWGDADRNGVSEPRELVRVASTGIRALGLDFRESGRKDRHGNQFRLIAIDGSSVDVFPVWRLPDSVELE